MKTKKSVKMPDKVPEKEVPADAAKPQWQPESTEPDECGWICA